MSDEREERVRALAAKATPGPWSRFDTATQFGVVSGEVPTARAYITGSDKCKRICVGNPSESCDANMDFIAELDPAYVLSLLDELAALRRRVAELERERDEAIKNGCVGGCKIEKALDEFNASLTRL